ncbi:MAG TPA: hypothetical protein VHP58_06935 [Alphaproteobacteria bacterium]|nr:hypothetical protein [Alphaproteobacteria bacterium]
MFHLLLIIVLGFAGLYYAETHGYIIPGGIIPDVTHINIPKLGGGSKNFDYWRKG